MTMRKSVLAATAAIVGLGVLAAPALAQRDPAYAAARADGRVGEKMDGYLGIVGTATPELQAMVDDINIRRRAVYAERAQAENATLQQYAFTAGCLAIARTSPGEMYQAPDGTWQRRGQGAPQRDPRCP
ncbi:YdbL family protein [Aurantiacibacter sp. MUD61]|uniref:YdbL family protein n=1 Tax=Aurantiacibacter sp. MUD61 TaxID=3009083 RepID=UPI0022F075A1|nr:YdbL family protein [Aurantiacibacter sp. MUD61]